MKVYLILLITSISLMISTEKLNNKKDKYYPFLQFLYNELKINKENEYAIQKENFIKFYSTLKEKLNITIASNTKHLNTFKSLAFSIWDTIYYIEKIQLYNDEEFSAKAEYISTNILPGIIQKMSIFLLNDMKISSRIKNILLVEELAESILFIGIHIKPEIVATSLANNLLEVIVPKQVNDDPEEYMMGLLEYSI